ncbi:beta-galactosidase [Azohydromonas lata]|uniref:Beta-galactosidase n=1 Tax=Azohydromonas lata TaxID=45677 RepID=A0ABU5IPV7_9BURK|nr:beta-galactosidase [Azohydromonas lata]MDZ5460930.1 beta-galactosidase [Azohydromonas lata]
MEPTASLSTSEAAQGLQASSSAPSDSLATASLAAADGGEDSADEGAMSVEPAPWELQEDEALSQAFFASQQAKPLSAGLASGQRVKWNPGHYIALSRRDDASVIQALKEIQRFPQVKGLLLRYNWRQMEPRKGDYQFSGIDRDIQLARAYGKRVFIMVETKAFRAGVRAVPDYMHTGEYDGGAYKIRINAKSTLGSSDTYGENAALHNSKVRDRLIALTTALGRRYNANNSVEGVAFNETAMGRTLQPLSRKQTDAFFDNLAQVDTATRRAFPNTVVLQFVNFPAPYMPGLVENMIRSSVGVGGPDTFLNDHDLNRVTYPLYDRARGKVPIGPSVQPENYFARSHNGPHSPPSVKELHAFAQNRLHANYLFWSRTLIRPLMPYNQVLRMFQSEAFPRDGSGGLNSDCPSNLGACVKAL